MKYLGEADIILNMKIICTFDSIYLSKSHYTQMVINKFGYCDSISVSTPCDPSIHLLKNREKSVNQEKYIQFIGSLIYLSDRTITNITYAISKLSKYTSNPSLVHWIALERVFRYLKGTTDYYLLFSTNFDYSTQLFLFYGIFIAFVVKTPTIFLNT